MSDTTALAFTDSWENAEAWQLKNIISSLCTAINKREQILGKVQIAFGTGPWYAANVNSGGLSTDEEWQTWWIGGNCDYNIDPDLLPAPILQWFRNLGEYGGLWLWYTPDEATDSTTFEDMPICGIFDERDRWAFMKCEGMSGTLMVQPQRENVSHIEKLISLMRQGIMGLMIDSLNRGSVSSGGHRAGATHYSAAFVFPCDDGVTGPATTPAGHCRWLRNRLYGDTPSCANKHAWCGDCGREGNRYAGDEIWYARPDWVFCDQDCFSEYVNNNNWGLEQTGLGLRKYCYWLPGRLLNYVNHLSGYITEALPLGYDGKWWWETNLTWKSYTVDGRTVKHAAKNAAKDAIVNSMSHWISLANRSPLDIRIWDQMKRCLKELHTVRYNLGYAPPGVGLEVVVNEKEFYDHAYSVSTTSSNGVTTTTYGGCWYLLGEYWDCGTDATSPPDSWGQNVAFYTNWDALISGGVAPPGTNVSNSMGRRKNIDTTTVGSGLSSLQPEPSFVAAHLNLADNGDKWSELKTPLSYSHGLNLGFIHGTELESKTVVDVYEKGIGDHVRGSCHGEGYRNCPEDRGWCYIPGFALGDYFLIDSSNCADWGGTYIGPCNPYTELYLDYYYVYPPCEICGTATPNHGMHCTETWVFDLTQITDNTTLSPTSALITGICGDYHRVAGPRMPTEVSAFRWDGLTLNLAFKDSELTGGSPIITLDGGGEYPLIGDQRWDTRTLCPPALGAYRCACLAWGGLIQIDGLHSATGSNWKKIPSGGCGAAYRTTIKKRGPLMYEEFNHGSRQSPWATFEQDEVHQVRITPPTNPDWFGESAYTVRDCRGALHGYV